MGENDSRIGFLDAALDAYGKVEPPEGLEARVLRKLEASRRPWQWQLWLSLGSATAVAGVVFLLLTNAVRDPLTAPKMSGGPAPALSDAAETLPRAQPAQRVDVKRTRGRARLETAALPKLETFPAPSPLSDQEQILISMSRSHREVLVAMAQPPPAPVKLGVKIEPIVLDPLPAVEEIGNGR